MGVTESVESTWSYKVLWLTPYCLVEPTSTDKSQAAILQGGSYLVVGWHSRASDLKHTRTEERRKWSTFIVLVLGDIFAGSTVTRVKIAYLWFVSVHLRKIGTDSEIVE